MENCIRKLLEITNNPRAPLAFQIEAAVALDTIGARLADTDAALDLRDIIDGNDPPEELQVKHHNFTRPVA